MHLLSFSFGNLKVLIVQPLSQRCNLLVVVVARFSCWCDLVQLGFTWFSLNWIGAAGVVSWMAGACSGAVLCAACSVFYCSVRLVAARAVYWCTAACVAGMLHMQTRMAIRVLQGRLIVYVWDHPR